MSETNRRGKTDWIDKMADYLKFPEGQDSRRLLYTLNFKPNSFSALMNTLFHLSVLDPTLLFDSIVTY